MTTSIITITHKKNKPTPINPTNDITTKTKIKNKKMSDSVDIITISTIMKSSISITIIMIMM